MCANVPMEGVPHALYTDKGENLNSKVTGEMPVLVFAAAYLHVRGMQLILLYLDVV